MPRLVTKIEGRGNGIKTCIMNMGDVARALKRPPQYTTKWFGNEVGAVSSYSKKEGEGERSIVNGVHETATFQTLLDKFIDKYVLCENCHLPEIDMFVKKDAIKAKCMACGWAGELDDMNRLGQFIKKNPPDESCQGLKNVEGDAKPDKHARRAAKLAKPKKGEGDDED